MATMSSTKTTISTSLSLIDRFIATLQVPPQEESAHPQQPSPLHLLNAAATSLKSSTTKLSLLTMNAPFTPSAVSAVLNPLNTSILTSLVTATLLTSGPGYPKSFSKECTSLTTSTLQDLKTLLKLVQKRSEDGQPKKEPTESKKKQVTESTGKIWEDCDLLLRFAKEDIPGFVVRKAKAWLELMKDAVKELEEWDPEEDDIDEQDWLGLDEAASSDDETTDTHEKSATADEGKAERATISAGVKEQALKVLSRIPQSIHVVVKQRLEKYPKSAAIGSGQSPGPVATAHNKTFDLIVRKTRTISDCIDESAEAMYLGDPELCLKKAGKARALTIEVVEAVAQPWTVSENETKEDQYIRKALLWIQQVDTGSKASTDDAKPKVTPVR